MTRLTKCPHCKSKDGLLTQEYTLYETHKFYDFDFNLINEIKFEPKKELGRGYFCSNCGCLVLLEERREQ